MLNAFLLWFLPLAAIPIVLHLITLYRLRTVELGTFRFLMESYVQQRRRLKLLEWLVMALRTAFVLLIILMLSRPVMDRFGGLFGGGVGRDVVILIDAGATMGLQTDASTSIQRAKQAARTVAQLLAPDDHVTVIAAGHRPRIVFDGFAGKRGPILDAIEVIEPQLTAPDLSAALAAALETPGHGARVVYLVTDARRRTIETILRNSAPQLLRASHELIVMDVGPPSMPPNVSVLGDPPRDTRPIVGLPVTLSAAVKAQSTENAIDTRVTLVIDDKEIERAPITISRGETAQANFTYTPPHSGPIRGRFQLPQDAFPDDDAYRFVLNVAPQISVLLVTGPAGPAATDNPALYIRSALRAPLLATGATESPESRIAQSIAVTPIPQEQLTPDTLTQADVAIVANIVMDRNRGQWLRDYVAGGGGLIFFPGPHTNTDHATTWLFADPRRPTEAAPIRYARAVGDPSDASTFEPIAVLDVAHPTLRAFDGFGRTFFTTTRLYQYLPVEITPDTQGVDAIMRSASNDTVFAEWRLGRGRAIISGFAATPDLTNLPLKSEFVPLLLQSLAHVRREAHVTAVGSVRPNEPAPVRLFGQWNNASVTLQDPAGNSLPITLYRDGEQLTGAHLDTDRPGYYDFRVTSGEPGVTPPDHRLGFAVNIDADALDFEQAPDDLIKAAFAPAKVTLIRSSPDDPVLSQRLTHRREIWRPLIWAMFTVIGIEFFLSTLRAGAGGAAGGGVRRWWRRLGERIDRSVGLSASEPREYDEAGHA